MESDYQYLLKVRLKGFKTRWVKFIDWEERMIYYTKDEFEAGGFEPYSRAVEVARFLENEPSVVKVVIKEI